MRVVISAPYMLRERPRVEALLPKDGLDIVWAHVKERLEEEELAHVLHGAKGIICGDDRFTPRVYDSAKDLRVIVKWGTGIDSINKLEAEKRGIRVCRTPDAFTDPVADTTLGYMLAHCRGVVANDRIVKAGRWDKPQGFSLSERVVGIVGLGAIGCAVAKRLQAFGAKVLACDVEAKPQELLQNYQIQMVDFQTLLEHAQIITIHCDLNATSRHLFNDHAFQNMRQRPYLINTARGPIIDENVLIEALNQGQVCGAALDVFEQEPLALSSPLRKMDQVLLASHNSNSSPRCWDLVHRQSINMLLESLYAQDSLSHRM